MNDLSTMMTNETGPVSPSIDGIIRTWIDDVRQLHEELYDLLTQRGVQSVLAPGSREALQELLDRLNACRAQAPSTAMVRYWAKTGGQQPIERCRRR